MPFIHIKSMEFEHGMNIPSVIKSISQQFSAASNINLEHITVTWDYFKPGHYATNGKTTAKQADNHHPILVDLLIPGFNSKDTVARMMNIIVDCITEQTNINRENVFIHSHYAQRGHVLDNNQIVNW